MDPPTKEIHFDPTFVVADDDVDEVNIDIGDAKPTVLHVPPCLSLRAMVETFMTTQAARGQFLDELISNVAALRADFSECRSTFSPPPPYDH